MTNVIFEPIGETYIFKKYGCLIRFTVVPHDITGKHPLDALQIDLEQIVQALSRLERPRADKQLPPRLTIEDLGIQPRKNGDSDIKKL